MRAEDNFVDSLRFTSIRGSTWVSRLSWHVMSHLTGPGLYLELFCRQRPTTKNVGHVGLSLAHNNLVENETRVSISRSHISVVLTEERGSAQ